MTGTVTVDTYCPGCKKEHPTVINVDDLSLAVGKVRLPEEKNSEESIDQVVERALKKREVGGGGGGLLDPEKEKEKPKDDPDIPSHVAKYHCKGCGSLHTNKKFKGLPLGKCDTCGEKFNSKKSGKCPYCKDGEIEELSDDDLEEMGIFLPDEDEHSHE